MTRLWTILVLAASATAAALAASDPQIRMPRLPRNVPREIPRVDRLPSLDDLLRRQPLTSSLDDAVTGIAFMDRFDPEAGSPLFELPFGIDDQVTLAPGLWEASIQSYCLRAGTYGPTRGDGYLWAPLKGPKADVISTILNRSSRFEDLPQHDVQLLLWGIIARTRVSQMPEGAQRAAGKLLSRDQIASIDGSAIDVIPDQWLNRVMAPVAAPVRRVLEAENRLRQAFANPSAATYQEIERIAVLNGVPPLEERGREVPARRWSYHPDGFFVRMMPSSYSESTIQLYVPERFTASRDGSGSITAIRDVPGATLTIDRSKGSMTFAAPGATPVPLPATVSSATESDALRAWQDVARIAGAGRNESQAGRGRDLLDVTRLVLAAGESDPEATRFLHRAWASAAGDWLQREAAAPDRWPLEAARRLSASAGLWLAPPSMPRVPQSALGPGWGGGGGSGGGGGFGGGSGGGMPGGGRQRLGPSLRKYGSGDNAANRGRDAIDKFGKAKNLMDLADPAGMIGFSIPDYLFGKILDFNFDTWGKASDALAGDPPRQDFTVFTAPEAVKAPQMAAGAGITAEQAQRLNALMRDLVATNAHLRAAIVALDRHGGAVEARDHVWASRQAHALVHLKREAGLLMLKVASHMDGLAAGAEHLPARTRQQVAELRARLEKGWTDTDRQAGAAAGLTAQEIEAIRTARLALDPASLEVKPAAALADAAAAVRQLGEHFASLPAVGAPW